VIADIASRAHGAVARRELLRAGVSDDEIKWRVRIGALITVYPGVYRVGHRAPSVEAWYVAAVKACGEGALVSGKAAAHLFGFLDGPAPAPEVTTPTERRIRGVKTTRSARVCVEEAAEWRRIPITNVPRTVVDLAAQLSLDDLARAFHVAGIKHKTRPAHVDAVLARQPNAPGSKNLRLVIHGDAPVLLSRLEKRFLKLLEDHNLPLPITNRPAGGKYVDCRWPDHKLTVELDSYAFHNSRHAFERDHRRQREAYKRGDQWRSYTYGDVFERPETVLAELQPLLTRDPGTMSSRPSGQRIQALWPPS